MLIETTQNFDSNEDAQNTLQGIRTPPGFLFAYVRQPHHPSGKYDLFYIFDCSGDTQHLHKQRAINSLTLGDIDGGWSAN